MRRHKRMRWFLFLLLGIAFLREPSALTAKNNPPALSKEALRCKTSLEKFRLRLEAHSQRGNPAYYQDLYRQVEGFLGTLEDPAHSFQPGKCETLLSAVQDIIGPSSEGAGPADLAPLPTEYSSPSAGGKLTSPTLEMTPRRPLRLGQSSIRYRYDDDEKGEEEEEPDDFKLTSNSAPSQSVVSGTKQTPGLEKKELE